MNDAYSEFVGKHVKLVYSDDGRDKGMTGDIEEISDGFIRIKDDRNRQLHLISLDRIVSVSTVEWKYTGEREWA